MDKETYKERMAYLISKGHDWFDHKKDLPSKEGAPMETTTTEATTHTKEDK